MALKEIKESVALFIYNSAKQYCTREFKRSQERLVYHCQKFYLRETLNLRVNPIAITYHGLQSLRYYYKKNKLEERLNGFYAFERDLRYRQSQENQTPR